MSGAKAAGQNNFLYYSPSMNVHTVERLELESDLSRALERGELVLHYQPKVEIMTGAIRGDRGTLTSKRIRSVGLYAKRIYSSCGRDGTDRTYR